jgi:hypothetical protein
LTGIAGRGATTAFAMIPWAIEVLIGSMAHRDEVNRQTGAIEATGRAPIPIAG